jgi:hypothetical protein
MDTTPSSQPGSKTETPQLLQSAPGSFSQGPIQLNFLLMLEKLWWANGLPSPRRIGPVKMEDLEDFSLLRIQLGFAPNLEELWWVNGLPLLRRVGSMEMGHLGDVEDLGARHLLVPSYMRLRYLLRLEQDGLDLEQDDFGLEQMQPVGMPELEQVGSELEQSDSELKQIRLKFEPSPLDLELISVSSVPFTLFGLPEEISTKIADFFDVQMIRDLMITCKSIRICLQPRFLLTLASEKHPDLTASGFIVDAIGNKNDTCLWHNAQFSLESHTIPKGLSIHLFTKTTAKKVLSHKVRSMIFQLSESSEPSKLYPEICEFLTILFSKVSFMNLNCLMLYGFRPLDYFSDWLKELKAEVIRMANFSYSEHNDFHFCDTLEKLYIIPPAILGGIHLPTKLKKFRMYCPESDEDVIRTKKHLPLHSPTILAEKCFALEEM